MDRKRIKSKIDKNILKVLKILRILPEPEIKEDFFTADMENDFREIYKKSKHFTITSIERMYSLYKSLEYIVINNIPGDVVECGVWKGGSMMLCTNTLIKLNDLSRNIYLYDTYEGMSEPTEEDIRIRDNKPAKVIFEEDKKSNSEGWCYATLDEVKKNLFSTGYPKDLLLFIKGKVEETIPNISPKKIAILRLDTDWYESTYHELVHLFPLLVTNGILIIDDYGYWKGSKMATDKYFQERNIKIFLNRIDNTCRIAIKL